MARAEGMTPKARKAVGMTVAALRASYGDRLVRIVLFGSRARGTAGRDSDADLAVVLLGDVDYPAERRVLSDANYDALLSTGLRVQCLPVSVRAWDDPALHRNPSLIENMRREGRELWPGA